MNASAIILASRRRTARRRAGQALVEYALILAFISVLTICVTSFLGMQLTPVYQTIIDALDRVRAAIGPPS
jgi:Flp pilus assembly pilin Flp